MIEQAHEKNSTLASVIQDRFHWYQVYNFVERLSSVSVEIGVRPNDLLHIGGMALFYRCYQAFGAQAVVNFRGTRDMDVISFRQGSVPRVVDSLLTAADNVLIQDYSIRTSPGLPNKKSITVEFKPGNDPKACDKFEIDLYESPFGSIRFNDRLIQEDNIVLDPLELLSLNTEQSSTKVNSHVTQTLRRRTPKRQKMVAVPSLRDAFIIKMDILDYSRTGLRLKDRLDVMTTLRLCSQTGVEFDTLLRALIETSSQNSALNKLSALEELFRAPFQQLEVPADYPFLPSSRALIQATKEVRRFRDYEIYKS